MNHPVSSNRPRGASRVVRAMFAIASAVVWADVAVAIEAISSSPRVPLLIRNEHGPLVRVIVDVGDTADVGLHAMTFSLEGTDDVGDIEALSVYGTDQKDELPASRSGLTFPPEQRFGKTMPPAATITFGGERALSAGKNVFWLSCRMKDSANLSHHVSAVCTQIETTQGVVKPKTTSPDAPHRIGIALRKHQDDGVHTYRIAALGTSPKGTLLCVYDMRRRMGRDLQEDIDIGLSRSLDGGQTWQPVKVIMDMGEYGGLPQAENGCSDPGIIIDQQTGEIFCFAVWMNGKPGKHQWNGDGSEPGFEIGKSAQFLMVRSQDDGVTWSKPENLTRTLKQESWWLLAPSPQSGFTMADGTLVMPVQGREGQADLATFATLMVSQDHGKTWTVGKPAYRGGNECQAALLSDGSIMLNMRNDQERFRAVAVTKDLGKTWEPHATSRNTLIEPNCNGSLLRVDTVVDGKKTHLLLFANPHTQKGRTHHTIQVSFDDGQTWPESHHLLLDQGLGAGYPSLTRVDDDHVGIVYEGSQAHLTFERIPLRELLHPRPAAAQPVSGASPPDSAGLSFRYERPAEGVATIRQFGGKVQPVEGVVHIYATVHMGPANPIKYVDGLPEWRPAGAVVETNKSPVPTIAKETVPGGFEVQEQKPLPDGHPQLLEVIAVGTRRDGKFTPAVRFGLGNDGRGEKRAHVNCWISDGRIDYFAPFARPNTPYDFKLRADLKSKRISAWVSGRGDDDWFLVAENVPLHTDVDVIDAVQVEMSPEAPVIEGLQVRDRPDPALESVRPHPLTKPGRVVDVDRGFRFQALRSTWRKPGKHVTIFRKPGSHHGFPDVAQAGKDHLVCVWRNSSHTGGGGGGLSVAHSYDLGQTWDEPTRVPTPPGTHRNCPRLQRLKDGTLLLLVDVPSGGDQTVATWDLLLYDSKDEGKTWINERWLRAKEVGGGGCIVPSRIAELDDGTWFLAASYFAKPGNVEILDYYRSKDRGKTWEFIGQPHHFPPHSLSEPSPIQLADGRLFVIARESRADGLPGAKGSSADGGKTWKYQHVPFPITGRTCAGLLQDGRLMVTFRSGVGRAALRAWIGDVDDPTGPQPAGGHYNDRHSIGLKDGVFHLDSDGNRGQFTMYNLRPADSEKTIVDLTFEVLVQANAGRAASVSVPFAGVLRLFPDHVVMAHNPKLRAEIAPGEFHTYRVVSQAGRMELFIDGKPAWDTDQGDSRLSELPWTLISSHALAFGNEPRNQYEVFGYDYYRFKVQHPDVYAAQISADVTGYSQWRRFEAVTEDPAAGRHVTSWSAARDGFPDQHQLDHIVEVEASANGHEQGYSGWVQLDDGRIFVVHYTDDTAPASSANPHMFGVPWIRGTFLKPEDVPPVRPQESR